MGESQRHSFDGGEVISAQAAKLSPVGPGVDDTLGLDASFRRCPRCAALFFYENDKGALNLEGSDRLDKLTALEDLELRPLIDAADEAALERSRPMRARRR